MDMGTASDLLVANMTLLTRLRQGACDRPSSVSIPVEPGEARGRGTGDANGQVEVLHGKAPRGDRTSVALCLQTYTTDLGVAGSTAVTTKTTTFNVWPFDSTQTALATTDHTVYRDE